VNTSPFDQNVIWWPKATDLMGLDIVAFWSDAVYEPPTGEHWTDLGVQL